MALTVIAAVGAREDVRCTDGAVRVSGPAIEWGHSGLAGVHEAVWCELDGRRHGAYIDYYPDGGVFRRVAFVAGRKSGEMITYYPDGSVWSRRVYAADQLVSSRSWHPNGVLSEVASYVVSDGHREGAFTSWDEKGRKLAEGHLRDGKAHGEVRYFDVQGDVRKIEVYRMGVLVEERSGAPAAGPD